jgi:hypothetical protein
VVLTAGGVIITPEVWDQVGPTPDLVVIDGGMPRAVTRRDGVRILGLDDLAGLRDMPPSRGVRRRYPAAEAIVAAAWNSGRSGGARWRWTPTSATCTPTWSVAQMNWCRDLDERAGREVRRTLRRSVHDHVVALRAAV